MTWRAKWVYQKTVLHDRFIEVVGCPPIQYLTEWRMQLAAERLQKFERYDC